jgi:hypothetical protein
MAMGTVLSAVCHLSDFFSLSYRSSV